jgi:uncharacterized protein (DUF1330 family)
VKNLCALTLAMIAGFALGILADQPLAQIPPPPAYVVTLFDSGLKSVTDTEYPSLNPATFQAYGGRYIIHFGRTVSFDGRPPNPFVVIAFDSMTNAQAWHSSDVFRQSYDARKLSDVRAFAVEGIVP